MNLPGQVPPGMPPHPGPVPSGPLGGGMPMPPPGAPPMGGIPPMGAPAGPPMGGAPAGPSPIMALLAAAAQAHTKKKSATPPRPSAKSADPLSRALASGPPSSGPPVG